MRTLKSDFPVTGEKTMLLFNKLMKNESIKFHLKMIRLYIRYKSGIILHFQHRHKIKTWKSSIIKQKNPALFTFPSINKWQRWIVKNLVQLHCNIMRKRKCICQIYIWFNVFFFCTLIWSVWNKSVTYSWFNFVRFFFLF